jgi:hypothetical protein
VLVGPDVDVGVTPREFHGLLHLDLVATLAQNPRDGSLKVTPGLRLLGLNQRRHGDHSRQFVSSGTLSIVLGVEKTPKTPKPPYTSVSDVDAFFDRVQTIAEPKSPKKVDSGWVESYQFQTAHPSAIPSMLRWLGVIDENWESTGSAFSTLPIGCGRW